MSVVVDVVAYGVRWVLMKLAAVFGNESGLHPLDGPFCLASPEARNLHSEGYGVTEFHF